MVMGRGGRANDNDGANNIGEARSTKKVIHDSIKRKCE